MRLSRLPYTLLPSLEMERCVPEYFAERSLPEEETLPLADLKSVMRLPEAEALSRLCLLA